MRWELSDGTVVTSDGTQVTVQGGTGFAEYLRERATARGLFVPIYPPPGGDRPLTPSSALSIDSWLEYEIRQQQLDIVISARPEVGPLPDPGPDAFEPNGNQRVY